MAPLKERDQSSYVWRVCHWDKNSYQLFSLFQKYIWRREGATHLRRCNGQCGGSPSDSRAVAGDIAVISDRIREMSVDEWWPKKKVKRNKRRRHVVTFWELLIVWKMRLRFSFFFSIARCTCIYILFRFLSSSIQSGAVCDRNPPRSLLNGCDLLTLCLDMSRFSSFLQLTVGPKKKERKKSISGRRKGAGGGPRIGGDGLSPAIFTLLEGEK